MFPILNIEELRARVLRMFGSRLAAKRGLCWSAVVVPIALVPCPSDWGTLVGISRLHPPGLPYPRLQYLTLVGELLWELGIRCLQFCAHIRGNSYPLGTTSSSCWRWTNVKTGTFLLCYLIRGNSVGHTGDLLAPKHPLAWALYPSS